MTMIKCPACRHHISSMAKACPECGHPIDPEWAQGEAERELKKLQEVPFTVEVGGEESPVLSSPEGEDRCHEQETEIPVDGCEDDGAQAHEAQAEREEPASARETAEPPHSPAPRRGRGWLFFIPILLLGLLVGGLYYYDYRQGQQREQRAYELLQGCSNPDFYEDFIIRYPRSRYIEEVRQRYQQVAQQQREWQELVGQGTREALSQFVSEHPTSPYVKVAQGRIDSLDWAQTRQLGTAEAVDHYMALHPDGYYMDQAEALLQRLERQRAEAEAQAQARRDSLAADSAAQASAIGL